MGSILTTPVERYYDLSRTLAKMGIICAVTEQIIDMLAEIHFDGESDA